MADELEKNVLRAQRDVALDVATDATVNEAQTQAERDAALDVAAMTAAQRDAALAQRNQAARERDLAAGQRNAAQEYAVTEAAEARGNAAGFYLLFGAVVLALIFLAGYYLTRPSAPPATGTTVNVDRRTVAPTPAPSGGVHVEPPGNSAPTPIIVHQNPPPVVVNTPPPVVVNQAPAPPPVQVRPPAESAPSDGPKENSTTIESSPDGSSTTTTTTTKSGGQ